jgi:hypothetical protein
MASKYAQLTEHLQNKTEPVVELTFEELDDLIGGLPTSARRHSAWWVNSRSAHDHARAWLDAGRRVSPKFAEGCVRFTLSYNQRIENRLSRVEGASLPIVDSRYELTPLGIATPQLDEGGSARRIGLVGCVKDKAAIARRAQDLYQSPLFQGRRRYVQHSCNEWWILSALHGLVGPDETLEPYDVTLNDASIPERREWSGRVLNQIVTRIRPIVGDVFECHAGNNYRAFGLEEGLRQLGCTVDCPTEGLRMGEQLSFYSRIRWT